MISDLALLLGPERRRVLWTLLGLTVLSGLLSGLAGAALVPAVAHLAAGDLGELPGDLFLIAVATLAACVVQYVQAMRRFRVSLEVMDTVHRRLGDHLVTLPLGWYGEERTGGLSKSATQGAFMISGLFSELLTPVIVGITAPATVTVAMLVYDWRLGLVALVCIPVLALAFRFSARCLARGERLDHAAAAEAGSRVIEFARCQAALRAFGRSVEGYRPLDDAIEHQRRTGRRSLWLSGAGILTGGVTVQFVLTALLIASVWLAAAGQVAATSAVALLALAFRFAGPLAEAAELAGVVQMAGNDLRRAAKVLHEPSLPGPSADLEDADGGLALDASVADDVEADADAPAVGATDAVDPGLAGAIELDGVGFGYRAGEPVLRDVSFRVPPRSMTALVGASGSGKTTITRLIARFWDTDAGVVRVGGVDVRDQSTEDLMAQLAVVFQDVYLFDDTLEANIRLGRPDATDDEVREAAHLAGVDEIIDRLPDGWSTRVGEAGARLSGGERQRVSVARALLKDAPVVLLDEATAALDPENERFVQRSLHRLAERSTLLVIAHHLDTVAAAGQIVVLDEGRVAEVGTHDELLSLGGRYAEFWESRRSARGWRLTRPAVTDGDPA